MPVADSVQPTPLPYVVPSIQGTPNYWGRRFFQFLGFVSLLGIVALFGGFVAVYGLVRIGVHVPFAEGYFQSITDAPGPTAPEPVVPPPPSKEEHEPDEVSVGNTKAGNSVANDDVSSLKPLPKVMDVVPLPPPKVTQEKNLLKPKPPDTPRSANKETEVSVDEPDPQAVYVKKTGGATAVFLVSDDKSYSAGKYVPPGSYTVMALFPEASDEVNVGRVIAKPGSEILVNCDGLFMSCTISTKVR